MKKLCSILLAMALVISMVPNVISAVEDTSPTTFTETISTDHITLGLTATGTENSYTFYQGDAVTREFGNIVLTFSEGCKIYNTETRVYESNYMSIAPKTGYKITSIVLNTTSKKPIGATVHNTSTILTNATTNCVSTDTVATLTPIDGTNEVRIQAGVQFRITSLVVTYEAVVIDNTCTHELTYTYNNDNTHNAACDCGDNTLQNEACVDADSDKECDLCGGELTGAETNEPQTETINTNRVVFDLPITGTENSYNYYQGEAFTREFGNIVLYFGEGCKIYDNETRVYASNSMSIAPKAGYKITSIVITTTTNKPIGAAIHNASTTLTNATTNCVSTDNVATLIPVDGTQEVRIQAGVQFRATSLVVTYEAVVIDNTCTHEYTYTYNNDNTHNAACDCGDNTLQNVACVDENSDKKCDLCGGELTSVETNVPQTETINTNRVTFDLPITGTENSYTFYQGEAFTREFGNIVLYFSEGCKIYDNEARVYESNSLTIAPKAGYKITSIVITSTSNKPIGTTVHTDATVLINATTNCVTGDATATFIPINGTKEVIIQAGTQFRAKTIVVTYEVATAEDLNPPSGDDNQGGVTTPDGAIGMNKDSFGLTANKTDSTNTAYYQDKAFSKSFGNYTISFDIGKGEQYPAAYGNEIRVYASNVMTITPKAGYKIVSIVVHSQVGKPIGASVTNIAGVVNNATHGCVSSEATATFTPINGSKAVVIKAGTQFRITSIEVVYEEDASHPTGDAINMPLFGMLMTVSLVALVALVPLKKRYF